MMYAESSDPMLIPMSDVMHQQVPQHQMSFLQDLFTPLPTPYFSSPLLGQSTEHNQSKESVSGEENLLEQWPELLQTTRTTHLMKNASYERIMYHIFIQSARKRRNRQIMNIAYVTLGEIDQLRKELTRSATQLKCIRWHCETKDPTVVQRIEPHTYKSYQLAENDGGKLFDFTAYKHMQSLLLLSPTTATKEYLDALPPLIAVRNHGMRMRTVQETAFSFWFYLLQELLKAEMDHINYASRARERASSE